MIDIVSVSPTDLVIQDTQTVRAANIFSVQIGDLTYQLDFGVDMKYFFNESFKFQNDSFKSYLVQRLANYSINVGNVVEVIDNLSSDFDFYLNPSSSDGALISR